METETGTYSTVLSSIALPVMHYCNWLFLVIIN